MDRFDCILSYLNIVLFFLVILLLLLIWAEAEPVMHYTGMKTQYSAKKSLS